MSRRPIWRNRRKSKGSIDAANMAEPSELPLVGKQFGLLNRLDSYYNNFDCVGF